MRVTREFARKVWRDAPADTDVLDIYLSSAEAACMAYAPLAADAPTPASYSLAIVMQARNTWNSSKASPATGDFDGGGYGISAFPLDWQVQQLLRPIVAFGGVA